MLITDVESLKGVISKCEKASVISVDLETNGLHPYMGDRLIGIAIYLPEIDESFYVTFRHGEGVNLDVAHLELLKPVLSNADKKYYGWNLKFDQHFLTVDSFPILQNGAVYLDVMIALHLLDENRYDPADTRKLNYKLKDNGRLFLGTEAGEAEDELHEELKKRGITGKGEMWKLPALLAYKYAEQDVRLTWQLWNVFKPYLEKWNQLDLFYEKATFNSQVLARMEFTGVPVNRELIQEHINASNKRATEILAELRAKYGASFNPNSSQQVSAALNLPNARKATLEQAKSEEAQLILDYKVLSKAEGTFYRPYLYYSAFDGKIHPTFNVTRTNSGRLSSSDPNLQQTPKEGKYHVKEVFQAPEGYKFVNADYSQQELRLAAHFSGQQNITQIFNDGKIDTHTYTASLLFGKPISEISKDDPERQIGKTANFGFLYGMGITKAANYISTSLKKALIYDRKFFDANAKRLPKDLTWELFVKGLGAYAVFKDDALEYKQMNPDCLTVYQTTEILLGWKELYDNFITASKTAMQVASSDRSPDGSMGGGYRYYRLADNAVRHYIKGQKPFTAWNFLIQGTGALIMRRALIKLNQEFPLGQDEVYPIISVHDSAVFLVKDNENFASNLEKIKEIMEDFDYYPKMKVDIKVGDSWGNVS